MQRIQSLFFPKIWGYEIWLVSSYEGKETYNTVTKTKTKNSPLIKIIYAKEPLSVQVHPDDDFAKELENQSNGKSESWLILNKTKNAAIINGLKVNDVNLIQENLSQESLENVFNVEFIKKGDFIDIPAGKVHGVGFANSGEITLLEVQQNSDITYRLYDYNRKDNEGKPRELHISKALKVIKNNFKKPQFYFWNDNWTVQTQHFIWVIPKIPFICDKEGYLIKKVNGEYVAFFCESDSLIMPDNAYAFIMSK
ncbi:class I mannose-6-phosphate isomerase [Mycoplasmopsis ciconiae]|uniref:Class I mannose-6-phosphate isomerase n=1 Tax=Mycoplasmopsis ciconiae TaxID=561067 RepID=A0ABU7MKL9_9BACT|nr:class I mannose-6-phosphate isomerase [Mycoplasmopsis ciconiae]